ncbi:hypothetical protein GCM10010446_31810 [Streptomyces enissocaesilis]|uniref:Uncharacterized protein n=1 Tax=Streptomyces enissocaesilis TaxID=332589 RepID=A0ABN3XBR1_9ACTN
MQRAVQHRDGVPGQMDTVPAHGRTDQAAARGDLQAGEPVAAETRGPVRGERGVGAARDGVLQDALGR